MFRNQLKSDVNTKHVLLLIRSYKRSQTFHEATYQDQCYYTNYRRSYDSVFRRHNKNVDFYVDWQERSNGYEGLE